MADASGWNDAEFGLSAGSAAQPSASSPNPAPDQSDRPLTIKAGSPAAKDAAPATSGWNDAQFGLAPRNAQAASAAGAGPLANTQDDSWTSGGLKGAATGIIKGLAHIPGQVGDLHDLSRLLAAGASSLWEGKPAAQIYQEMKAADASGKIPGASWAPGNVLPSGSDISAPILKQTGEYQPTSGLGKVAQAGVEAASGGIGPGSGAKTVGKGILNTIGSTVKQAPLNAVAGAAGQAATDATGNPYLGVAASVLAPGLAESAGRAGFKVMSPAMETVAAPASAATRWAVKKAGLQGEGVGITGDRWPGYFGDQRDINVGNQMLKTAADKANAKSFAQTGVLPNGASDADYLPGPANTTGELLNDRGLLNQQRVMQRDPDSGMAQHMDDQNTAQQAALGSLADPGADRMAPSKIIQQKLDDLSTTTDLVRQRLASQAVSAAGPLTGLPNPEDIGAKLASHLNALHAQEKALTSKMYADADPNGVVRADHQAVTDAIQKVRDSVDPLDSDISPDEEKLYSTWENNVPAMAQQGYGTIPYKSVIAFDRNLNGVLPTATKGSAYRLGQVKSAVMDTLNNALDARNIEELNLKAPWEDATKLGPDAGANAARTGTNDGGLSGVRPGLAPSGVGAENSAGRGFGATAGSEGIPPDHLNAPIEDDTAVTSRPVPPSVPRPQDLHGFIKSAGGIQDKGGDLASMGLNHLIAKPDKGLSPDAMRQAAAQRGYLGADIDHATANTRVNDLLDALGSDKPVHSVYDEDAAAQWAHHDDMKEQYNRVQGPVGKPAMPPKAPLSAYDEGAANPPDLAAMRAAAAANPNAARDAAAQIAAAKKQFIKTKTTYEEGQVGAALATDNYNRPLKQSGALPGMAVKAGPRGYETAKAFLDAGKGSPDTIEAMKHAAMLPLKGELTPEGMVSPKGLAKWKAEHDGALRAIDEVSPGFSKQFDAPAKATDIAVRAGALREKQLQDFQASSAAKLLGKTKPEEATAELMAMIGNKKSGPTQIRQLMDEIKDNPDAVAGVRALAADGIKQKLQATAEAGGTGDRKVLAAKSIRVIDDNLGALQALFPKDKVDTLRQIALSGMMNNREIAQGTIKASAADRSRDFDAAHAMASKVGKAAAHGSLPVALYAAYEHMHGSHPLAIAGAGASAAALYALNKLRAHGKSVQDVMFNDAMTNPLLGQKYMSKALSADQANTGLKIAANAIRRALISAPIVHGASPKRYR